MHELGAEYLPVRKQPHVLNHAHKTKRMRCADQLCMRLCAKNTWPRIITGDEAWIYLRNDNAVELVFPWDTREARTVHGVSDSKIMLSVFWSTSGFHLIHFAPREASINSAFFIQRLTDLRAALPQTPSRKYFLHVDNAPSHRSAASKKAMQDLGLRYFHTHHIPRTWLLLTSTSLAISSVQSAGRFFKPQKNFKLAFWLKYHLLQQKPFGRCTTSGSLVSGSV